MPIITLTTDFGMSDGFAGAMKGVILSRCPQAQIVDISHEIPPQDVISAAMLLEDACGFFPDGTVHVAVVDPGVGTSRRAVAVETDRAFFVGPDNGLFELILRQQSTRSITELSDAAFHLPNPSATFHGRDIFAPAAARIAAGTSPQSMGRPLTDLVRLKLPQVIRLPNGQLEIHVLRVDRFGNLVTNLRTTEYSDWNPAARAVRFKIGDAEIAGLTRTYGDVPPGSPVAYFGSGGRLEVGVNGGSAVERFKTARFGTVILATH
jgi:S-adenosyl-L-methionine hydrolase (adenosine-forming)